MPQNKAKRQKTGSTTKFIGKTNATESERNGRIEQFESTRNSSAQLAEDEIINHAQVSSSQASGGSASLRAECSYNNIPKDLSSPLSSPVSLPERYDLKEVRSRLKSPTPRKRHLPSEHVEAVKIRQKNGLDGRKSLHVSNRKLTSVIPKSSSPSSLRRSSSVDETVKESLNDNHELKIPRSSRARSSKASSKVVPGTNSAAVSPSSQNDSLESSIEMNTEADKDPNGSRSLNIRPREVTHAFTNSAPTDDLPVLRNSSVEKMTASNIAKTGKKLNHAERLRPSKSKERNKVINELKDARPLRARNKKVTNLIPENDSDDSPNEFTVESIPTVSPSSRNQHSRRIIPNLVEKHSSHESTTPIVPQVVTGTRKKQPLRGNWSVSHLLQNPKSKLADCNLQALLSHPEAWSCLSIAQQTHLLSLLPNVILLDNFPKDEALPNVPKTFLQSNNSMQADVRLFQEDLGAGKYDPSWLRQADEAMSKRAAGDFDDWKEKNREEFWGQKQKATWANAGDSAEHSLSTLVRNGCFEEGDVFLMQRGWRVKGNPVITVHKEATITAINDDDSLSFSFPPSQHKYSAPANGADIIINNIMSPKTLSDAMLKEDGRIPDTVRGANAWREFRCFRRNQDIGGLWDVREQYHASLDHD